MGTTDELPKELRDIINGGAALLALELGCKLGIFGTMISLGPATIQQIAAGARIHPAHARDWVAALQTAGLAEPVGDDRFQLSVAMTTIAADDTRLGEVASYARVVGTLWSLSADVATSFRTGAGIDPSRYSEFERLLDEEHALEYPRRLPQLLNQAGLSDLLHDGAHVADLGCGTGRAILTLAEKFPNSTFVGFDLSTSAIDVAIASASSLSLTNVRFEERDLSDFADTAQYDLILMFDVLHEQAALETLLQRVSRALRPSGAVLCCEMDSRSKYARDYGTYLRVLSTMHCTAVSLYNNGIGPGLFFGIEGAHSLLVKSGFRDVSVLRYPEPDGALYLLARATPV